MDNGRDFEHIRHDSRLVLGRNQLVTLVWNDIHGELNGPQSIKGGIISSVPVKSVIE